MNRKPGSKSSFFSVAAIFLLPVLLLQSRRWPFLPFFTPTAWHSIPDGTNWLSRSKPCAYYRSVWSELQTLGYSFALRSVKACFRKMLLSIRLYCWPRNHLACRGRGRWAMLFTVYSLRHSLITQVSNCQDGCQTNSRRYDDLLSTEYRPRRPLKYVPRDCTCDGLRVRIKFMGLYGRSPLALAGFLVIHTIDN